MDAITPVVIGWPDDSYLWRFSGQAEGRNHRDCDLHRRHCPAFRRAMKEAAMRIPALAILAIAVLTATPAPAQTYDPKYPVCLQVYQGFTDYYFECAYTSLAQCNMSASGRAASCVVNPYYAGAKGRRDRKPRRVY